MYTKNVTFTCGNTSALHPLSFLLYALQIIMNISWTNASICITQLELVIHCSQYLIAYDLSTIEIFASYGVEQLGEIPVFQNQENIFHIDQSILETNEDENGCWYKICQKLRYKACQYQELLTSIVVNLIGGISISIVNLVIFCNFFNNRLQLTSW